MRALNYLSIMPEYTNMHVLSDDTSERVRIICMNIIIINESFIFGWLKFSANRKQIVESSKVVINTVHRLIIKFCFDDNINVVYVCELWRRR